MNERKNGCARLDYKDPVYESTVNMYHSYCKHAIGRPYKGNVKKIVNADKSYIEHI